MPVCIPHLRFGSNQPILQPANCQTNSQKVQLPNQHTKIPTAQPPGARGGVLEPEGVVEIKFRAQELTRLMHK